MSLVNYSKTLFPRWNNFFEGFLPEDKFLSLDSKLDLLPAANIEEKENEFIISVAVPGVQKEDINIEIQDNVITISSQKEGSTEDYKKNYSHKEYSYSSFRRVFQLPQNVKEDKIEANYENGELKLQIPKAETSVSNIKKIKVA